MAHSGLNKEIGITLILCMSMAAFVPLYTFYILKRKLTIQNDGAIAATYGSVSAVTFVTATLFLENVKVSYGGHMVAAMALMEAPAIIIGVMLMRSYGEGTTKTGFTDILRESLTNGSVIMITGSLIIGIISDVKGAEGSSHLPLIFLKGSLHFFF